MTATELIKAIAEARKEGMTEIEVRLQKKLDKLLDEPVAAPTKEEAPEVRKLIKGGWIHEQDGLGEVSVESSAIPKRSAREIKMASEYFDEGANNYAEDEARLQDMIEDLEFPE